jgi:hypothetical protein
MVQNFILVHLVIIEPSFAEVNVSLHCTKFCEICCCLKSSSVRVLIQNFTIVHLVIESSLAEVSVSRALDQVL